MSNNDTYVASVDIIQYIDGLAEWVTMYVHEGFEPYLIGFLFRLTSSNAGPSHQVMEGEIRRVYGRFLTENARYPWSKGNAGNRPVLIACPDWPIFKWNKTSKVIDLPHGGVHAGGILLVPPRNNLKHGVKDHFETVKRDSYIPQTVGAPKFPLSRIHIQHLDHSFGYVVDYAFKSLKRRRCTFGDIIVLPDSQSERP